MMKATFEIYTSELTCLEDIRTLQKIFESWEEILAKSEDSENREVFYPDEVEKTETPGLVQLKETKPKKEWNDKQKKDIQAIKDAVNAKKALKGGGKYNFRADIDDSLIVYMKDEQHMSLKAIAKQLKCCEQTVLNRYNKAKGKKS